MDFVIPLGKTGKLPDHGEFLFCLRSVDFFYPNSKVFVVGEKPSWLSEHAIHISCKDKLTANKDGNLINKVLLACDHKSCSKSFIRLSDDQIFLSKVNNWPIWMGGDFRKTKGNFDRFPKSRWVKRLKNTFQVLDNFYKNQGLPNTPIWNCDFHVPQLYCRDSFKEVFSIFDDYEQNGYIINTLYFNVAVSLSLINRDFQRIEPFKLTFEKEEDKKNIMEYAENLLFLGWNDAGLTKELLLFLKKLFPTKSRYEK